MVVFSSCYQRGTKKKGFRVLMGCRSLDHCISHSSALLLSKRNSTMGKAIIRFMCDRRSAYCKAQQYQRTACVYRIRKKWIKSNSKVDTNDIRKHCTGYRRSHGFKSRTGLNFFPGLIFTTAWVVCIISKIASKSTIIPGLNNVCCMSLPEQVRWSGFRIPPPGHRHSKLPIVLTHWCSQMPWNCLHSSTSTEKLFIS